jgi:hypothetical protein
MEVGFTVAHWRARLVRTGLGVVELHWCGRRAHLGIPFSIASYVTGRGTHRWNRSIAGHTVEIEMHMQRIGFVWRVCTVYIQVDGMLTAGMAGFF